MPAQQPGCQGQPVAAGMAPQPPGSRAAVWAAAGDASVRPAGLWTYADAGRAAEDHRHGRRGHRRALIGTGDRGENVAWLGRWKGR